MSERIHQRIKGAGIAECSNHQIKEPFVMKMSDGSIFRIDNAAVVSHNALVRQLATQKEVQIKFCVSSDEELDGTDEVEQYEIVFFPMYVNGLEVAHGAVVDYEDSVVNGNLTVKDKRVALYTSNHVAEEYEEIQNPVTLFASKYLEYVLKMC